MTMSNRIPYRKDDELRRRLNAFLCETFRLPKADYYNELDLDSILGLKSVLSDINNALTMRLTLGFVEWVGGALKLDSLAITKLRNDILSRKPNANGYDVYCSTPHPFVAEVKCNVPINNGTVYGSAQKNGIIHDIESLLHGKPKGAPVEPASLKFMVFLDLPAVRAANEHLKSSSSRISKEFSILMPGENPIDPKVVYGVYIALGA